MTGAIENVIAALNDAAYGISSSLRLRGCSCPHSTCPLDTTTAVVISLPDPIDLKLQSGRVVDLADVEALRAIAARSEP